MNALQNIINKSKYLMQKYSLATTPDIDNFKNSFSTKILNNEYNL